jgi:hypothetical protein
VARPLNRWQMQTSVRDGGASMATTGEDLEYNVLGGRSDVGGQRPHASRRGLARAPLLTSPLAVRQEPFGRSVDVHILGWRLSPRRWKSRLKQVDGVDEPVGEAE